MAKRGRQQRADVDPVDPRSRPYRPYGAALDLFYAKDTEVALAGGAGTGKSRAVLEKMHLCMMKYPNARALLVRKERASLSETTLATWEQYVVQDGFFRDGAKRGHRSTYDYPNGSQVVLGGLDAPIKIMSGEYDLVVVDEATAITEDDWEFLISRLRNFKMPYVQALAACNPAGPTHWIKQRADRGRMRLLSSRLTDNPKFFAGGDWTPEGRVYKATVLDGLTGVRRERLLEGRWAAAEGLIFPEWDPDVHVVDLDVPRSFFTRFFASVDWGFIHPGVMQVWGLDHDGRMYLVHEVYQTGRGVEWWADKARRACGAFGVNTVVCDSARPDYIAEFRRAGVPATEAYKSVMIGLNAVSDRLRRQADGRPRLFVLRDCLDQPDQSLVTANRPWKTEMEFASYVWDPGRSREQPRKELDDGMDTLRMAVCHADGLGTSTLRVG